MREAGFTEQRSPPSPVSGRITDRWLSGPHSLSGFSIGPSLFSQTVTDRWLLGPAKPVGLFNWTITFFTNRYLFGRHFHLFSPPPFIT
ncbi:hypothetical protein LINGRAHAP2_LOCUS13533 [Linum grandiflorum]